MVCPRSDPGSPIQERLEHLLRLCQASGAKGAVFYGVKFCEPELFDLPDLSRGLQEAGIPSVSIEVDIKGPLSHQALTRLEVLRLSKEAALWLEALERNKQNPAPITVFDQFIHMAPIVGLRGEARTVDFYAALLEEMDGRIARGIGAVKGERKRLLWDNLPIWYRLRYLAELPAERGIAVVASTYTNAWGELAPLMDPERPFQSMARTYIYPILNRGAGYKLQAMRRMIEEYRLDGVILHSDRFCKPYSIGQMDQRERLNRDYGIPALLLEADHNDRRAYAKEQVANGLATFIELLEARGLRCRTYGNTTR